jgi:phosphoenolpyruvate synthase/pyruvate phosphate dikinase
VARRHDQHRDQGLQSSRQIPWICGQGPSDHHPDLAEWLLEQRIDTMSLNPDTVVETWIRLGQLAGGT